jgi:predicted dienelactone hydrolase
MMSERNQKIAVVAVAALLLATALFGRLSEQPSAATPDTMGLYESPRDLSAFAVDDSVVLALPGEDRDLPLRVVYPQRDGPHPVIVFSHGTFSSGKRYDPVANYWAERGYVVILPDHVDANYGVIPKKNEDMFRVIRTRVTDMSVVVDGLGDVEREIPALAGQLDRGKLIAAGHSVGTQIAMIVTGMRVRNPTTQEVMQSAENRYRLLIMLSDPGKMAMMPAETWVGSGVPTLLSTGSEDFGLMGDGRRAADFQNDILADDQQGVDRYLLLLERGDHYFGGLIHKEADGEPDHEGLAIFNAVSAAFLDAYAMNESVAREYMRTVDLPVATGGRANLTLERQDISIEEELKR